MILLSCSGSPEITSVVLYLEKVVKRYLFHTVYDGKPKLVIALLNLNLGQKNPFLH